MRAQHNKIVSHNFLSLLVELLKCVDRKEMLIDVLDSVNEMVGFIFEYIILHLQVDVLQNEQSPKHRILKINFSVLFSI